MGLSDFIQAFFVAINLWLALFVSTPWYAKLFNLCAAIVCCLLWRQVLKMNEGDK